MIRDYFNHPPPVEVWALYDYSNGEPRGIYSSEENLKDGVEYWINKDPNTSMYYLVWSLNYAPEPSEWESAYVVVKDIPTIEKRTGEHIPTPEYWNTNLVGERFSTYFFNKGKRYCDVGGEEEYHHPFFDTLVKTPNKQ